MSVKHSCNSQPASPNRLPTSHDHEGVGNRSSWKLGVDRRQLLTGVFGGLLASLVVPSRGVAQQADAVPLSDRLALITTGGTNVLAFATADGLVMVDSGAPEFSDRLAGSLRQL